MEHILTNNRMVVFLLHYFRYLITVHLQTAVSAKVLIIIHLVIFCTSLATLLWSIVILVW